jgi:hypothetical protein
MFMRALITLGLIALTAGCSGKNVSTRDIQPENLPAYPGLVDVDIFSVDGIENFESLADESLDKDSYSNVVIKPLQFRLPEKKMKKADADDKETVLQAFEDAKAKVFKDFQLADQVNPDSLVIYTYLTDEIPSNPVVNVMLFIIVPSLAVGAAAIGTEAFIGDQVVAVAGGARKGTIGGSGYTKWGVVEQGFEIWLTGIRQWLDHLEATSSHP